MENLEKVQKHFNFKFVENWNDQLDFFVYEESTADGYSVYVATDDPQNIVISEDVYYYDSDLSTAFVEAVEDHSEELTTMEIYVENEEDDWIEEAIETLSEMMNESQNEIDE
jgi:hypothetical protein